MKKINGEIQRLSLMDKYNLIINLEGKFVTERGRINCSLRENDGFIGGLVFSLC